MKKIEQKHTLFTGVALSILIGLMMTITTNMLIGGQYFLPLVFIIGPIVFFSVFLKRIEKIEIGCQSILIFLGKPTEYYIEEGINWVPWPLSKETHSISEQKSEFPPTKEEEGIEITCLKNGQSTQTNEGKGRLLTRVTIFWKITNLKNFVIFDENHQGDKIVESLRSLTISTLRERGAQISIEEFISSISSTSDKIKQRITATSGDWGISVIRVVISKAEIADPETKKVLEKTTREIYERSAEQVENDHINSMIAKTAEKLYNEGKGLPWPEAMQTASDRIMAEREKITPIVIRGAATIGDFATGAAISSAQNHKK